MFGCALCEGSDELMTQGFEGGAKILFTREGSILPWLKVGAIYHKAKFNVDGVEGESDWGFGFQAGGGVDIPLGNVLSFSPALRYQKYTATFEPFGLEFLELDNDVSFLSLDMGLHIHFGHGG
jgi:opacity protein-like surface antigen